MMRDGLQLHIDDVMTRAGYEIRAGVDERRVFLVAVVLEGSQQRDFVSDTIEFDDGDRNDVTRMMLRIAALALDPPEEHVDGEPVDP